PRFGPLLRPTQLLSPRRRGLECSEPRRSSAWEVPEVNVDADMRRDLREGLSVGPSGVGSSGRMRLPYEVADFIQRATEDDFGALAVFKRVFCTVELRFHAMRILTLPVISPISVRDGQSPSWARGRFSSISNPTFVPIGE